MSSSSLAAASLLAVTLVIALPLVARASFCGPAAIPFSFEALPSGAPVLGCARPSNGCFGSTADGKPAASPSTFYRVNKKPDGYFRKNADTRRAVVPSEDAALFVPQFAKCAATFDAETCAGDMQWLGGIGPSVNVSTLPLALQCCEYEALKHSADRGIAVVNAGQIVIGGEVQTGERQYAFDYISDIAKSVKADGSVSYDVSVRRMPCIPHPPEFTVGVESAAIQEISTRFGKPRKLMKAASGAAQAFQAPIQSVSEQQTLQEIGTSQQVIDSQPQQSQPVGQGRIVSQTDEVVLQPTGQERVDVVQGPFVAEPDAIVEEVQASEGLELPEGQVPQGLIQPPAQPAYAPAPAYGGGYGAAGGGGGASVPFCFTADTTVKLADGSRRRMDELQVNDWIMSVDSSELVLAKVNSWLHRDPALTADFHRIELTDGKVLKLTAQHYLYKSECSAEDEIVPFERVNHRPVYAERVEAGDCLYVISEKNNRALEQRRVARVDIVREKGIYAPMTSNGDLVVNDIFASCHNVLDHQLMQRSFFDQLPTLEWLFGKQDETTHLPLGTSVALELMEYVLPASFLMK